MGEEGILKPSDRSWLEDYVIGTRKMSLVQVATLERLYPGPKYPDFDAAFSVTPSPDTHWPSPSRSLQDILWSQVEELGWGFCCDMGYLEETREDGKHQENKGFH